MKVFEEKYNISIILPVYNAEKKIQKCIQSILTQDYKNIELILINDGSTDDSLAICNDLALLDKRIQVISTVNQGPAKARNLGIIAATGDFITFVDADDYVEANCYRDMTSYIDENSTIDVVISSINLIKNGCQTPLINSLIPKHTILESEEISRYILSRYYNGGLECVPSLCNKLYRREFLTFNQLLIDESRVRAEDYWFNFEVFKRAEKIVYTDTVTYNYVNESTDSIMQSYRSNDVDNFILTRNKLLHELNSFQIEIESDHLWSTLFYEVNEHIFKMIEHGCSFKEFDKVLITPKLIEYLNGTTTLPKHHKFILTILNLKLHRVAFVVFKIWSKLLTLKAKR